MSRSEQVEMEQSLKNPASNDSFRTTSTDVPSETEAQAVSPPAPKAVDGGVHGWLRVLGAHLLYISSWGLLNAYGAYAQYYQSTLLPDRSPSDLAWPGTLQAVLIIAVGVLSGPLFDRGHLVSLLVTGCALVVVGMFMLSLATEYYQIVLSQGLCVGLGSGIMFVPSLTLVSISFQRHRAWAIAVATCGAAVGGVVFPLVLQHLLPVLGFAWSTRVLAFIAMVCCAVGGAISLAGRHLLQPKPPRTLVDVASLRDGPYLAFSLAVFFIFLAYFVPIFYISEYAAVKLRLSPAWGVYTLVILNAATTIGRLGASWTAATCGPIESMLAAVAITVALLFGWTGVTSLAGLIVWAVVFGIVAGPIITLPASILPLLTPDLAKLGTRMGMTWLFAALGGLVGAPVAGALIRLPERDFRGAQAFAGAAMVLGAACLVLPLVFVRRRARS